MSTSSSTHFDFVVSGCIDSSRLNALRLRGSKAVDFALGPS